VTFVLRLVRQGRWDTADEFDWLAESDIPADPLADFADTTENRLSVWLVDDQKKGLDRVLAGLAANREKTDKPDYVLFPTSILESAGIELEQSGGNTPDGRVNETHRNLIHLSATQVLALTTQVWHGRSELKRVGKGIVRQLIAEGVRDGRISMSRLRPKLRDDVRRYLEGNGDEPRRPK